MEILPTRRTESFRDALSRKQAEARRKAELVRLCEQVTHLQILVEADCLVAAAATAREIAANCEALKASQVAAQQEIAVE